MGCVNFSECSTAVVTRQEVIPLYRDPFPHRDRSLAAHFYQEWEYSELFLFLSNSDLMYIVLRRLQLDFKAVKLIHYIGQNVTLVWALKCTNAFVHTQLSPPPKCSSSNYTGAFNFLPLYAPASKRLCVHGHIGQHRGVFSGRKNKQ